MKAFQEEAYTDLAWRTAESEDALVLLPRLQATRRENCNVATEAKDYLELLSTQSGAIAMAKKQRIAAATAAAAAAASLVRS